jgi:hypothetical protein
MLRWWYPDIVPRYGVADIMPASTIIIATIAVLVAAVALLFYLTRDSSPIDDDHVSGDW